MEQNNDSDDDDGFSIEIIQDQNETNTTKKKIERKDHEPSKKEG